MKMRLFAILLTLALALAFIPAIPGVQAATEVTPSSGPVIEKVSMTVDGQLYVNFKVLANDTDVSGYKVRLTIGEGANQFAYYAQDPVEEEGYWVYKAAMAAHRMPENVVIELVDSTGATVQVKNWSIIEYLQKAGASDAANVPLNNLVDAMADYGSYAAYYAQESGALSNVGAVKPNIAAVENVTVSQLEGFKSTAKSTYSGLQPRAALELRENVDLQFSFNKTAFGSSTVKINGVPVTATVNGDRMVYTIQDIRPTDWGRPYKVEVTDGTSTFTMSYSVLSYVRAMLSGSADANGFHGLMKSMYLYWAQARDYAPSIPGATVHIGDITGCRDPFILEENGVYYMYYTGGVEQGVKAYTNVRKSTDLIWWTQPIECFNSNNSANFLDYFSLTEGGTVYGSARCMAPEVHKYTNPESGETAYYMFVTFSTKDPSADGGIATAILRAESPEGQFTLWSDGPVTPAAHGCIDGTLYVENGTPYVVYAHEWSCTNTSTCLNSVLERGSFCYTELTPDLKAAKDPSAAPKKLFSPWSDSKVTDGPFVYTDANGANWLLWSTTDNYMYQQQATKFTTLSALAGTSSSNIQSSTVLLNGNNSGHGMIFSGLKGEPLLVLHNNNTGSTSRPVISEISLESGNLAAAAPKEYVPHAIAAAVDVDRILDYSGSAQNYTWFIGDSFFDGDNGGNTEDATYWNSFYADYPNKAVLQLGISSSTAEDWYYYFADGIISIDNAPKNIVINLGNNDIYDDGLTADAAAQRLQKLISFLKSRMTGTNLYLVAITQRSTANTAVADTNSLMQAWCANNGVKFVTPGWTTAELSDGIHPADTAYTKLVSALNTAGIAIEDRKATVENGTYTFSGYEGGFGYSYEILQENPSTAFTLEADVTPEVGIYDTDWNQTGIGFVLEQDGHSVLFMYEDTIHIFPIVDGKRNGKINPYDMGAAAQNANIYQEAGKTVRLKMIYDSGSISLLSSDDGGKTWTANKQLTVASLNEKLAAVGAGFSFDPSQAGFCVGMGSFIGASDRMKVGGGTVANVSYSQSFEVSGTVADNGSGTVTADGYTGTVTGGAYTIKLPNGTYDLHFDCGTKEGLLQNVTVNGAAVTEQNLDKLYPKLTMGYMGNASYSPTPLGVLTANGTYQISGALAGGSDCNVYGIFNPDAPANDFVVTTRVQNGGQVGIIMDGYDSGDARVLINLQANGWLSFYGWEHNWPGGSNIKGTVSYNHDDFMLTVVKKDTSIYVYINGTLVQTWNGTYTDNGQTIDTALFTDVEVGLMVRGTTGATYSGYSFSTEQADIDAALAGLTRTVSGTVAGNANGTVVATGTNGTQYSGALTDGNYSLDLLDGTYKLYFDCGTTEGLIPSVTVDGTAVTVPTLEKTYQKLTPNKYGAAGTADWVLTDNGKYEVQTSDENVDAISMGYFVQGVDMATTDFAIETKVQAAGNTSVMIGLAIQGTNANGGDSTAVFGLGNNSAFAQIRVMGDGADWPGYKSIAAYDYTEYTLKIVKEGTTITYFINGTKACSWTSSDYNFAGWTNVKVGIGFYRMYDVTFSDYSYTPIYKHTVSGTVSDGSSGTVTVTNVTTGEVAATGTLANGSYSVNLYDGEYKLYFDCGTTEGLIPSVTVDGADMTVPALAKTYQKLLGTHVAGTNTGNWVLTDNGKYEVQTTNASTDGITMGYFAEGVDMNTTDFVIETDVQAAGTNTVMLGLALNGINGSYTNATMVFGLNNANTTAQLRTFDTGDNWPANGYHSSVAYADGDRTNFHLKIVKSGDKVSYFIDGAETATCNWSASDFNFGTWTNVKVGLGFYRSFDVTFSNYSYKPAYAVSGNLSDASTATVTATDVATGEVAATGTVANGAYSIALPDGEYKLYFDCGTTEGLIPSVTVSGAPVSVPALTKTYQKLLGTHKEGSDGTANWVLTDNGKYQVQTSNTGGNSITMGYFAEGVDLTATNFRIETLVEVKNPKGNSVMLGLAINGTNTVSGGNSTMVIGLNNANNSAQICVLGSNSDWPNSYRDKLSYDHASFRLTIIKNGDEIQYYIGDTLLATWYANDYNFKWTDAKIGLGFYRMYDVTFSDYSYTVTN